MPMRVSLIAHTPRPLLVMAGAARVTQGHSFQETATAQGNGSLYRKVLQSCYDQGHLSVFEFSHWVFSVEGISRVAETQVVRHRQGSYAVESGRHAQDYEAAGVGLCRGVLEGINDGIFNYNYLISEKEASPEDARYALPQGVSRKLFLAKNFRDLMNVAGLRLCSKAQKEHRILMELIKKRVHEVSPFLAGLLKPECEVLGYCRQQKCCGRSKPRKEVIIV
jgi:thymidylate synthase (FAD)